MKRTGATKGDRKWIKGNANNYTIKTPARRLQIEFEALEPFEDRLEAERKAINRKLAEIRAAITSEG
jgi:molybdopterin biosynthesis enzyme